MSHPYKFTVIEFECDSSVEIVPFNFINNNQCPWPSKTPKDFGEKLRNSDLKPEDDWPLLEVKVFKSYESYEQAERKVKKVLQGKELEQTDCETPKSSRRRKERKSTTTTNSAVPEDSVHSVPGTIILTSQNLVLAGTSSAIEEPTATVASTDTENLRSDHLEVDGAVSNEKFQLTLASQSDIESLRLELRAFQLEVVTILQGLKQELQNLKGLLNRIGVQSAVPNKATSRILQLIPVGTVESYNLLQEELSVPQSRQELIDVLKKIGGDSLTQIVNGMLASVFQTSAAKLIGLTERSGKLSIQDAEIGKVIRESVHEAVKLIKLPSTDDKINKAIGKWFRNKAYQKKTLAPTANANLVESAASAQENELQPTGSLSITGISQN